MAIRGIKKYEKTEKEKELEKIQRAKDKAFGERIKLGIPVKKKEKEEKVAVDPNETVGGKRIKKKGPPIIAPKRKDDVGVGGYQEPLEDKYPPRKFAGGGRATHGYGKAYMKGGRVK